jgi:hypothetical protein
VTYAAALQEIVLEKGLLSSDMRQGREHPMRGQNASRREGK